MSRMLVVSGIPGEIEGFVAALPGARRNRIHGARFSANEAVAVGSAGPGKVRAAATLEAAIARFEPAGLIVVGTCGALYDGAAPGDVVVPDFVVEHDVDWRASGLPLGSISKSNRGSIPDSSLRDRITALEAIRDCRVVIGTLLTGDTVVDARILDERPHLEGELHGIAADMETAALAAVARLHRLPWAAVRVVTDIPRDDRSTESLSTRFRRELPEAARRIERILRELLLAEGRGKD